MVRKSVKDTYSYKGWLVSDTFLKRALAVLGYSFVGTLIFYAAFLVIVFGIWVIISFLRFVF